MEMEFTGPDGKKVVLWEMHQYPPKIVSSHSMEAMMRHGDIEWEVECYISDSEPPIILDIIQMIFRYYFLNIKRFLVTFLQVYPQIEDLSIL
jgi:hypothetical protein